jgi:hypothetical protein
VTAGRVDYRRHFAWLGAATLALAALHVLPPRAGAGMYAAFALLGALHAAALALAVRPGSGWPRAAGFVAVAAALSAAAPLAALLVIDGLRIRGFEVILVGLVTASAFGAAAYWVLVRLFLGRSLALLGLPLAVAACVMAPFAAATAAGSPLLRNLLLPLSWWLAFSASLALTDRARRAGPGGLDAPA